MKTIFLIFSLLLFLLSGCSNEDTSHENANQNSNYEAQKQLANAPSNSNTSSNNTNSTNNTSSSLQELYRFSTTIYTKTEERQNNVRICCNELNGHVVASGETFSFCDTLRSG